MMFNCNQDTISRLLVAVHTYQENLTLTTFSVDSYIAHANDTESLLCKPSMESHTQRSRVLTVEEDPSPWLAENGVLGLICRPPTH